MYLKTCRDGLDDIFENEGFAMDYLQLSLFRGVIENQEMIMPVVAPSFTKVSFDQFRIVLLTQLGMPYAFDEIVVRFLLDTNQATSDEYKKRSPFP